MLQYKRLSKIWLCYPPGICFYQQCESTSVVKITINSVCESCMKLPMYVNPFPADVSELWFHIINMLFHNWRRLEQACFRVDVRRDHSGCTYSYGISAAWLTFLISQCKLQVLRSYFKFEPFNKIITPVQSNIITLYVVKYVVLYSLVFKFSLSFALVVTTLSTDQSFWRGIFQ